MSRWFLVVALVACDGTSHRPTARAPLADHDPDGPRRPAIAAQVQPFLDAEIVSGLVVGVYDAGKVEIYGFGIGPNGKRPDGRSLFELGATTKIFTGLLLAEAVQRREVSLDTPIAELLPPGVTAPVRDKVDITLRHLVLHSSGLPRVPPSFRIDAPDPYAGYNEEALYRDLIRTQLEAVPGTQIAYSTYGAGLLGFLLGRKHGGFEAMLAKQILEPLGLRDTFVAVPASAAGRRMVGTTDDLAPVKPWNVDVLAGANGLVSSARDMIKLVDAELDAAVGSRAVLRQPMHLTQEAQLDHAGENEGLGWQIDNVGRFWHSGGSNGFHAFIGFDPKTKHGVVILAATNTSLADHLADQLYAVLDGTPPPAIKLPTPTLLAAYAGAYDLSGTKLVVAVDGKRLYLEGPGEPRHRMVPVSDHEFWIEALQSVAEFQQESGKIARVIFGVGDHQLIAPRAP